MHTSRFRVAAAVPFVSLVLAFVVAGCALVPWIGNLPRSSPGPFGTPGVPAISRDEAVAIARTNAEQFPDGDVLAVDFGTWAELRQEGEVVGPEPAPTDPVWRINLGYDHGPLNAAGEILTIDATDGRLLQQSFWIA